MVWNLGTAVEQGYRRGAGARSGVMVGGEVSGLQRSKREDLKECWGDSQISLESGYQQGVTGLSVGEGLGTIRVTLGP